MRSTLFALLVTVFTTLGFAVSSAAEEPGAFAKGGKLPGDLSDLLDADADGAITDGEAQKAARDFAKKAETDQALLEALDKNKDGKVADVEAADAVAKVRAERDEAGKFVAEIFGKLDANGDDFVSALEFQNSDAFGPLGVLLKPQLGKMLAQYDTNRDGALSFTEAQMVADVFAAQTGMKRQQAAAAADAKYVTTAQKAFAALDTNRNEKISSREAKRDPGFSSVFDKIDTDGDNNASMEEVVAFLKTQG